MYVQGSAWYPADPTYFVQIVNYVVPSGKEYDVETYHLPTEENGEPIKEIQNFDEIFASKITGCALRLV